MASFLPLAAVRNSNSHQVDEWHAQYLSAFVDKHLDYSLGAIMLT